MNPNTTNNTKTIDSRPLIAREGWLYLSLAVVAAVIAFLWFPISLFVVFLLVALFVLQFFRDPNRAIPQDPDVIVSPADGKVIFVGEVDDPYLDRKALKISVFMNVFSVHSNRSPLTATVKKVEYSPGLFVNADLDKASEANERNAVVLEDEQGRQVVSVQVAGLVARRILCYSKVGDQLERGQRYGFIRFGSRVDLFLPTDFDVKVSLGDNVSSGSDILGHL